MKTIRSLLKIVESNPQQDPYVAIASLKREIKEMMKYVDSDMENYMTSFFRGSAGSRADSQTLIKVSDEINRVHHQLTKMKRIFKKELKIADENIGAHLRSFK